VFLLDRSGAQRPWRPWAKALATAAHAAVAAALLVSAPAALAKGNASAGAASTDAASSTVALSALPREAQQTHQLILSGGPFPYAKDGVVFGNRERQLPKKARGFYHEYTVKTPGARNRGARRIVCGGQPPSNPEVCYYTEDHYASFRKIVK
jgi:ribonuclease T1